MNEIFIPFPSKEYLDLYLQQDFDGFIIGLKNFSSNFNYLVDVNDLENTLNELKKYNLKYFISLDRLYYNYEIEDVKIMLKKVINLDIDGIFYTDNGVLNILNELGFKKEIVWLSNHLGTNSYTANFLKKRNVSKVILSNEITINETIDIINHSKLDTGVILYGFLNMATSSRKLLSNYFSYTKKEKKKDNYYMKDKVKKGTYKVVENENTNFYTDKVLNGIKYYPSLIDAGLKFVILDDYMIAYSSLRKAHHDKEFVSKLEKVVDSNTYYDTFYGFFEKKTVYKVEDYE